MTLRYRGFSCYENVNFLPKGGADGSVKRNADHIKEVLHPKA